LKEVFQYNLYDILSLNPGDLIEIAILCSVSYFTWPWLGN